MERRSAWARPIFGSDFKSAAALVMSLRKPFREISCCGTADSFWERDVLAISAWMCQRAEVKKRFV